MGAGRGGDTLPGVVGNCVVAVWRVWVCRNRYRVQLQLSALTLRENGAVRVADNPVQIPIAQLSWPDLVH